MLLIPALKQRPGWSAWWVPGQPELHSDSLREKQKQKRWNSCPLLRVFFLWRRDTDEVFLNVSSFSTNLWMKTNWLGPDRKKAYHLFAAYSYSFEYYTAIAGQPSLLRTKQFKRKTKSPSALRQRSVKELTPTNRHWPTCQTCQRGVTEVQQRNLGKPNPLPITWTSAFQHS